MIVAKRAPSPGSPPSRPKIPRPARSSCRAAPVWQSASRDPARPCMAWLAINLWQKQICRSSASNSRLGEARQCTHDVWHSQVSATALTPTASDATAFANRLHGRTPGLFALFVSSHARHQESLPSQAVQLKLPGPRPSSNENPDVSYQPSFPALPRSSNSTVCCQQTDSQTPRFLDRAANPRWRLVPWPNKTATPPTDHRQGHQDPTAGACTLSNSPCRTRSGRAWIKGVACFWHDAWSHRSASSACRCRPFTPGFGSLGVSTVCVASKDRGLTADRLNRARAPGLGAALLG
jgi:hypothetical protein